MRSHLRLCPLGLALACVIYAQTLPAAPAAPATQAIPPEILQSIAEVHQWAQRPSASSAPGGAIEAGEADAHQRASGGRVLAVGIGAVAGMLIVNFAAGGLASIPLLSSLGSTAPAIAAMDAAGAAASTIAISPIYGLAGAVAGGVLGDYVYRAHNHRPLAAIPADVALRVQP
jgi:hypothetical protein